MPLNPFHFPDWMIRRDSEGCRAIIARVLGERGLAGRFAAAVSPWCGDCSIFIGTPTRGSCPGVRSETALEPPACLINERGILVAAPWLDKATAEYWRANEVAT